jgi:type I restriction enzyme R subunit
VPYPERVDRALTAILSSQAWNVHQRKWLKRIADQMKASTIVDREALDRSPFTDHGGFTRLNKIFGGKLEDVLGRIGEAVWKEGA